MLSAVNDIWIHRKWLTNKLKGGKKVWLALCLVLWQAAASPSPVLCITLPGWAMNKQPSKESLKDKVKGIFGLGTQRPPNKQSDTKPSEFIITADIIKVCRSDWVSVHVHWMSLIPFPAHLSLFDVFSALVCFRSSTQIAVWATVFALWTTSVSLPKWKSLRRWVCWRRSIFVVVWWTVRSLLYLLKSECICCPACSGGCMEKCGRHADSRAATRGQTCCPAAAQGHYTGAGIKAQHTRRQMQKASVCFLFFKKSLAHCLCEGWATWPSESLLFQGNQRLPAVQWRPFWQTGGV